MDKLYICRNCQYVFPKGLSKLIENEVQVYCEMCGTPFSLSGVSFKQTSLSEPVETIDRPSKYGMIDKERSSLDKAIKSFNKFDYIPIIVFSIITLILSFFNFRTSGGIMLIISSYLIVFSSLLIIIYDSRFISPRIKSNSYDEIALDAICYGILGCIIYGTGVIILIKGILIFIYTAKNSERGDHKVYQFGLKLKNSINNFSAKAGFVILLLVLNGVYFSGIKISILPIFTALFNDFILKIILASLILMSLIILIIDLKLRKKLYNKIEFTGADVVRTFILGVLGTVFLSIGIFILLKSILLLLLFVGKPIDLNGKLKIKEPETNIVPVQKELPKEPKVEQIKKEEIPEERLDSIPSEPKPQIISAEEKIPEEETEEVKIIEEEPEKEIAKDIIPKKKVEDIKLRLHESLLPVKNEKDRKVVKEYFAKIFNIISKDLRKQILELDIPKKERKSLLKELAFLAEEEQLNYLELLRNLYKEIPMKLIERIRKLPDIQPKYYDKLVEELKYMDNERQIEFVQFLEKNT
jgi:hypothetical protein